MCMLMLVDIPLTSKSQEVSLVKKNLMSLSYEYLLYEDI